MLVGSVVTSAQDQERSGLLTARCLSYQQFVPQRLSSDASGFADVSGSINHGDLITSVAAPQFITFYTIA